MRRALAAVTVLGLLGLADISVPGRSAARPVHAFRSVRVSVDPGSGSPSTFFAVSFRAPDRTGRHQQVYRRYELRVSGPDGSSACVSSVDQFAPPSSAHARVRVTLHPKKLAGSWCPGTFHGTITEVESPVCAPGVPCPPYLALLGTVGRFKFTVVPPPANTDTTPPVFGGIKSAFACTPGPQRPGQTTPFTLTWDPATDNVTPGDQIVYDVYESTTAGGESFSTPTWTTAPGVTTFKTPGLPSHGTFYFVVRARDQAGNEDRNDVEVQGVDPCL